MSSIIITGAGSGIGRALAAGFSRDGYRVFGFGRNLESLMETQRLCGDAAFSYHQVDVRSAEQVSSAVRAIESVVGDIFGLVCNAAVYPKTWFLDQEEQSWGDTLQTNVVGVANCCRSALPGMLGRNAGRIVIIGSLADMNPLPGSSAYSVSKAALHSLTRALAAETDPLRYPNVLINEYLPSATRTAMSDGGEDPAAHYPRVKKLVEFPSGGPTGRAFRGFEEFHFDRSPKSTVKRMLKRVLPRR